MTELETITKANDNDKLPKAGWRWQNSKSGRYRGLGTHEWRSERVDWRSSSLVKRHIGVMLIVIIFIIMIVMPTHLMKRGVEMCRNGGLVKGLRSRRREWGEGKWGRNAWQGQGQPWKGEKAAVLPQKLQLQVELEILRCDRR